MLLMTSLWMDLRVYWPLKALVPQLQTYKVGAHFKALTRGVLVVPQTYQVGAHFEALTRCVLMVPTKGIER